MKQNGMEWKLIRIINKKRLKQERKLEWNRIEWDGTEWKWNQIFRKLNC